jgi:hypothetical protein
MEEWKLGLAIFLGSGAMEETGAHWVNTIGR